MLNTSVPTRQKPIQVFSIICQLLLALFVVGGSSCDSSKSVTQTPEPEVTTNSDKPFSTVDFIYETQLMPILDRAAKENKPVFIDFYTDWCLPCKLMDEDVFVDKRLGKYMNKHFINLKLNAEEGNGRELAAMMEVRAYPTLIFLNAKGQVLVRKEGAAYQEEMYRLGDEALLKFQNVSTETLNGFYD